MTLDNIMISGDMGTGGAPSLPVDYVPPPEADYGPVSPEQLAKLARPLNKEEQKAADEWKAKQTKKPAALQQTGNFLTKEAFAGLTVWQVALGSLGVVSILAGVVSLIRGPRPVRYKK